jgi:hypothetical protein
VILGGENFPLFEDIFWVGFPKWEMASLTLLDEEELSTEEFQGVRVRGESVKALPTPAQRRTHR